MLGLWGPPFSIVETVAFHHNPAAVGSGPCEVLAAVHVADALVDSYCGDPKLPVIGDRGLDLAFLDRNGLSDRLAGWRAIAEDKLRAMSQTR